MANLMDYLDWRGDISLEKDPFNEVDNLILAELAYVDFSGCVPGLDSGRRVSVREAAEHFWSQHTREEVMESRTLYHLAPLILEKLPEAPRFAGMELAGYTDVVSAADAEQMAAVTCFLPDGTAYAAFRGTDDTIAGWKEDFTLSFLSQTPGQARAAEYLTEMFKGTEMPIRVGGHSKGGNFAVFASAFCAPEVRTRIREVYTNDGPGFLEYVTAREEYRGILPRIVSIIPEQSVFGLLLDSGYGHLVVRSDKKGLWQHDGFSWQVRRNRFETAEENSEESRFVERTLSRWIEGIPLEERKEFVDTVFELIAAAGEDTLSGLQRDGLKSLPEIARFYRKMDEEDQKWLRAILKELIRAGAEVWREKR